MKEIPLTQGEVALVDDEDYAALAQFKWCVKKSPFGAYAIRPVLKADGKSYTTMRMHRQIMAPTKGLEVDHINGDGLDNRRRNLRICTTAENHRNSSKHKNGTTSQYKGVYWWRARRGWRAQIGHLSRSIYLGTFDNEQEAALAYNDAAIALFGEFARINDIGA